MTDLATLSEITRAQTLATLDRDVWNLMLELQAATEGNVWVDTQERHGSIEYVAWVENVEEMDPAFLAWLHDGIQTFLRDIIAMVRKMPGLTAREISPLDVARIVSTDIERHEYSGVPSWSFWTHVHYAE